MMGNKGRALGITQEPLNLTELRNRFADRMAAVETAARDWGVRPEYPEGVFISSMITTQTGFADLALSVADAMHRIVEEARATAEDELARQRVVTERTRLALTKAGDLIQNVEASARAVIAKIEVEKAEVLKQLITDIVPEMMSGVRAALVIREHRYNHQREWRRALGTGALMLALVVGGYVWGTWSDWGLAGRVERIGAAIERCQLTSHWADDKGRRLCEMSDFAGI